MAAVLCAAAAAGPCDHLDCSRGPFLVVFAGSNAGQTFFCVYSSDAAAWGEHISTPHREGDLDTTMPIVLVGKAIYFRLVFSNRALKFDLESRGTSVIALPRNRSRLSVLMTAEDGGLGCATLHRSKLYIWSREEADAGWTRNRAIDLAVLLPDDAVLTAPVMAGFADDVGVIVLRANNGLYSFDLKTHKVKKLCEGERSDNVVPCMSFHTLALGTASTGEGPRAAA